MSVLGCVSTVTVSKGMRWTGASGSKDVLKKWYRFEARHSSPPCCCSVGVSKSRNGDLKHVCDWATHTCGCERRGAFLHAAGLVEGESVHRRHGEFWLLQPPCTTRGRHRRTA